MANWIENLDQEQLENASLIAEEAKKAGVPPNLAVAMALRESSLRHQSGEGIIKSSKGAMGIMQLMPKTAEGLNVDPEDKIQNIRGGVNYIKQMLNQFDNDPMIAAAAYNHGPSGSFFKGGDLPEETKEYLKAIQGYGGFEVAAPPKEDVQEKPSEVWEGDPESGYGNLSKGIVAGGGAVAGAAYGLAHKLAPPFERPSSEEFLRAQKRLREAEIGLNFAQSQHGAPAGMVRQLQQELQSAQAEMARASERLRELPQPVRDLPQPVRPGAAQGAEAAANARKIPGASGAENYARVMAGQALPDVISAQVEDMRKANPRGTSAYQIAEKDAQALAKIRSIGEGSQKLVGSGAGQLMLPEAEVAKIEQEAARRAAIAAAERQQLLQSLEQERARLKAMLHQGSARVGDLQSQLRQAQQAAGTVGRAQDKVSIAQLLLEEAEKAKVNPLAKFGYAIARNPIIANTLAGLGTAMSAQDAINSYRQGDPFNAISSGIEAGFGGLSMLPFLPAKGIGAAGGLTTAGAKALADYLGSRYSWGTSKEAEEAFRPSAPPKRQ